MARRKKPYVGGQTIQWPEERSRKSEDRQYNDQKKEAVSRRTDNTMARRKRTNGQTAIYETLHKKQKIEQTRTPLKNGSELRCSGI
jgi:hypothetical protein